MEEFSSDTGVWTREGIVPNFELWVSCRHNVCSYRTTQLLTGHGSFGNFLFRIKNV